MEKLKFKDYSEFLNWLQNYNGSIQTPKKISIKHKWGKSFEFINALEVIEKYDKIKRL
ncbi:hypothetical protein KAR91_05155 [Candidatus Pacearchaeota archaeon]|nr:hypothetical protein [Candidatus Pacearchaeota archaeon]